MCVCFLFIFKTSYQTEVLLLEEQFYTWNLEVSKTSNSCVRSYLTGTYTYKGTVSCPPPAHLIFIHAKLPPPFFLPRINLASKSFMQGGKVFNIQTEKYETDTTSVNYISNLKSIRHNFTSTAKANMI